MSYKNLRKIELIELLESYVGHIMEREGDSQADSYTNVATLTVTEISLIKEIEKEVQRKQRLRTKGTK